MSTGFKQQLHWFLLKMKYQTSFESILQNIQWLFWSFELQFQNGAFVVRVGRLCHVACVEKIGVMSVDKLLNSIISIFKRSD